MRIEDTRSDSVRPGNARPAAPVEPVQPARPIADAEKATASIRVDISAEGRALAARQSDEADADAPLAPERLAALRRWVHSGAFEEPVVIETVARRLLESGEI